MGKYDELQGHDPTAEAVIDSEPGPEAVAPPVPEPAAAKTPAKPAK